MYIRPTLVTAEMTKEEKFKDYLFQFERSKVILKDQHKLNIGDQELSELLSFHFDFDSLITHSELVRSGISAREIVEIILKEKKQKVGEVIIYDFELPWEVLQSITKAEIKLKGMKWTIHKYDVDPFPSNPHAHNYHENLKLHLGTGEFYRKKQRVNKKMKRKELLRFRSLIEQKIPSVQLPKLK